MIKPTAVEQGLIGAILTDIERNRFKIVKMKMLTLTKDLASTFYQDLSAKPFFCEIIDYATSGPVVAMVLEKENAVPDFRQLIGATDFREASYGTIRKKFAVDKMRNAIHGSDSDENAAREAQLIFG